jgi:hypothetical protein
MGSDTLAVPVLLPSYGTALSMIVLSFEILLDSSSVTRAARAGSGLRDIVKDNGGLATVVYALIRLSGLLTLLSLTLMIWASVEKLPNDEVSAAADETHEEYDDGQVALWAVLVSYGHVIVKRVAPVDAGAELSCHFLTGLCDMPLRPLDCRLQAQAQIHSSSQSGAMFDLRRLFRSRRGAPSHVHSATSGSARRRQNLGKNRHSIRAFSHNSTLGTSSVYSG